MINLTQITAKFTHAGFTSIVEVCSRAVFKMKAVHQKSCENVSVILQWISPWIWNRMQHLLKVSGMHFIFDLVSFLNRGVD
jgi:hypothetical protein